MTSPYALQAPPVALYYIWNNGSYIPTASETEYVNWLNQGYKPQGMLGGIALNPNVGGVSGLVPLYRYYRSANGQYALSLSSNDSTLAGNGFAYQNCQGYVFPVTTGSAAGGCPLYEYYKGATYQYFYSTSSTVQTGSNGYVSDGVKAYILPDWIHYYH